MKKMKVKIKHLNPNPFRDLANYPFNKDKIEQLKKSIEATGFWDNILARQYKGKIEIAYGHHRLRALQEVFSPDYQVEVPIKDLSDELMLKIMANENMEEWHSSVAIIDETVRATLNFLLAKRSGSGSSVFHSKGKQNTKDPDYVGYEQIAEFLGWPETRVQNSFIRINAIKKSGIDKKAVESIPTASAATTFVSKAKAHKLTVPQQTRVAKVITESENYSPEAVTAAVLDEVYPKKERKEQKETHRQEKMRKFDNYLIDISIRATALKNEIASLRALKNEILDFNYKQQKSRVLFKLGLEGLELTIKNTLKELNNE